VTAAEATRVLVLVGQIEIALVRRDPVAGPLLSQAARAAEGLPPGRVLAAAAGIARAVDLADTAPAPAAARKVAQAMVRLAQQETAGALLERAR
jgi:hypothetical protein